MHISKICCTFAAKFETPKIMSEEIRFDKRNYRKHSKKNKALIKKSLEELGAGRSVVIDADDTLVSGNGVYEQAEVDRAERDVTAAYVTPIVGGMTDHEQERQKAEREKAKREKAKRWELSEREKSIIQKISNQ